MGRKAKIVLLLRPKEKLQYSAREFGDIICGSYNFHKYLLVDPYISSHKHLLKWTESSHICPINEQILLYYQYINSTKLFVPECFVSLIGIQFAICSAFL